MLYGWGGVSKVSVSGLRFGTSDRQRMAYDRGGNGNVLSIRCVIIYYVIQDGYLM
jgi:hypothetical protein